MTKRKKVTRAYKVGHTDGRNGEHKNPYPEGSQWAFDYERGYDEGKPGSDCPGDSSCTDQGCPHHYATQPQLTCYQCDKPTEWLASDSRCGDCTRMTVEEVSGC